MAGIWGWNNFMCIQLLLGLVPGLGADKLEVLASSELSNIDPKKLTEVSCQQSSIMTRW